MCKLTFLGPPWLVGLCRYGVTSCDHWDADLVKPKGKPNHIVRLVQTFITRLSLLWLLLWPIYLRSLYWYASSSATPLASLATPPTALCYHQRKWSSCLNNTLNSWSVQCDPVALRPTEVKKENTFCMVAMVHSNQINCNYRVISNKGFLYILQNHDYNITLYIAGIITLYEKSLSMLHTLIVLSYAPVNTSWFRSSELAKQTE